MRSGVDCPMCADGHLPVNEHGDLIAELPGGYARLCRNQTHAGYAVVIAKRHAVEVHDLTSEELQAFWGDVAALGRTITNLFDPVKLDNLVMGHLCPHVHCHVYPQYSTSDPHALINIQEGAVRLGDDAWNERLEAVRADLASHHPFLPLPALDGAVLEGRAVDHALAAQSASPHRRAVRRRRRRL